MFGVDAAHTPFPHSRTQVDTPGDSGAKLAQNPANWRTNWRTTTLAQAGILSGMGRIPDEYVSPFRATLSWPQILHTRQRIRPARTLVICHRLHGESPTTEFHSLAAALVAERSWRGYCGEDCVGRHTVLGPDRDGYLRVIMGSHDRLDGDIRPRPAPAPAQDRRRLRYRHPMLDAAGTLKAAAVHAIHRLPRKLKKRLQFTG